ncbi:hypothetical protein Tco_1035424 [Tanacetum coccineum]
MLWQLRLFLFLRDLSVESMGSSFQDDPSESLLPPVYVAPMVSPFLCLDDSESDAEMSKRHVLPTPHDAMLTRALTARKSVRPLPSHHLALRHTPLDTTIADSSSPPRFVYPPLARTLWCSDAYRRWRSTPLSTMYPPTTSKSSAGDSSSESSVGPSHKRCRTMYDVNKVTNYF